MNTLLTTHNLNKQYETTRALNNVNMTIKRGDIYGFVGENGAGKSTLIRIITRVNPQTSGEFTLNVSQRLGSVAAIVETPAIHQRLSAFNNLKYQSDLLAVKKSTDDLNELLTLVGLSEQIGNKKQSRNFSLGMKQRLSIALALLSNPEFILLDEPMNGLDPTGIREMRELIVKLNARGVTFLISSHILSELDKIATVYGFISKGVLVEEIDARALHAKIGAYTKLKVELNDIKKIATLLKDYEYDLQDDTLIINRESDGQKVMQLLIKNEVNVLNFEVVRESVEDYYFKVIGGSKA